MAEPEIIKYKEPEGPAPFSLTFSITFFRVFCLVIFLMGVGVGYFIKSVLS